MRGRPRTRAVVVLFALIALALSATGCARSVGGQAVSVAQADDQQDGQVDTDQFDKLTLECQVLTAQQIATAVGGGSATGTFNGAICRWIVLGATPTSVTFNWFESGDFTVEKRTGKRLGYETENIKVASQSGFTQRDPKRPSVCGVTARAPSRGVYTWWVEPRGAPKGDPCAAPTKLMEMLLNGGQ